MKVEWIFNKKTNHILKLSALNNKRGDGSRPWQQIAIRPILPTEAWGLTLNFRCLKADKKAEFEPEGGFYHSRQLPTTDHPPAGTVDPDLFNIT